MIFAQRAFYPSLGPVDVLAKGGALELDNLPEGDDAGSHDRPRAAEIALPAGPRELRAQSMWANIHCG
jgi:hypothetical protein